MWKLELEKPKMAIERQKVHNQQITKQTCAPKNIKNRRKSQNAREYQQIDNYNSVIDIIILFGNLNSGENDANKEENSLTELKNVTIEIIGLILNSTVDNDVNKPVDKVELDLDVLREFLRIMLCGNVSDLNSIAEKLLIPANALNLKELKIMCEAALAKILTVDNVSSYYALAEDAASESLKEEALRFIETNIDEVMNISTFESIAKSSPQLAMDFGQKICTEIMGF